MEKMLIACAKVVVVGAISSRNKALFWATSVAEFYIWALLTLFAEIFLLDTKLVVLGTEVHFINRF